MQLVNRFKKSFLSMSLIVVALAGSTGLVEVLFQSKSSAAEAVNHAEAPIFSFMSISDIHNSTANLSKALDDSVANNVSAIAVAGDITNTETDGEYDAVMNMMKSKPHAPVYYAIGNHEYDYENDYQISKNRFLTKTGAPSLNYDKWINGYHFIFLGPDYKPQELNDETISWLDSTLASNADPSKPIFLFMHQPIYQTVSKSYSDNYGSSGPQMYKLQDVLKKYPQSVFITGHLHDDIKLQGNLFSEEFSAVRDGAVINNQGLIVDVYNDKVQMRGRDLNSKTTIWNGTIQLRPNTTGVYEAEDGAFSYATNADNVNASGSKVVNMKNANAYLEMPRVDGGASGGQKILKISYASAAANASMGVYVNGTKVQTLSAPTTGGTGSYSDVDVAVEMKPGLYNNIAIKSDNNAAEMNLDKLQIIEPATYSTMWGFNSNGNDSIPNGFNATLHGSAVYDTANKMEGSASLSLDGADGNYASADIVTTKTDDVTLTAWVKWNGATSGSQMIVSNGDGRTNGYSIALDHDQGDKVSIAINGQTILGSQTALTAGQWTNITALRRSGTWELAINGTGTLLTNNTTTPVTPTTGTIIGADSSGKQGFNGRIDAVRVYNQALSTDQIKAIANETSSAKLESITITNLPTQRSYAIGESFKVSGLTVVGTYSDGSTGNVNVTADNVKGFKNIAPGTGQTLTVTVGGRTATFTVDIYTLKTGTVSVPGKIAAPNYIAKHDQVLVTGGLDLNYLTQGVWMDYSVNVKNAGTYRVNYLYGRYDGGNAGIDFIVDDVLQKSTPLPSSGAWDPSKIATDTVALTEGPHTVRLRLNSGKIVFRSLDLVEQPSSIAITTPPTKLTYFIGDSLDISGMVVTGTYSSDGSTKTESVTAANVSGFNSSFPTDNQILTVTVGDKTTTFSVEIKRGNVPPIPEPLAWWKFDETDGTIVADSSTNGITGTAYNNPTWTAGKFGGAISLNMGSTQNQRIEFPSAKLNPTDGQTVTFWFKTTEPNGAFTNENVYRHDNHFTALQLSGASGAPRVAYWPSSAGSYVAVPFSGWSTYKNDNWHHYAAAYDKNIGLKIYVDGVQVASNSTNIGTLKTSTAVVVLGAVQGGGGESFKGSLDDVRVYGSALTQSQVQQVMNPVTAITVSGAGGANVIITKNGTLQMQADVLPEAANNRIAWSVYDADGIWATDKATIDANGLLRAIKDGQVNVVATATDGSGIKGAATITISGQVAPTIPQASLIGLQQVNAGQTFTLTMGLTGVTQSVYQQVYGQDLMIHYDPRSLQFNSVTSLKEGFQVIGQNETVPGQVRIVAASVGENVYALGDMLSFQFTAKTVPQATYMTTISVDNIVIANGQGNELQVGGASHEIQISIPVDKSLLTALIANAQAKYHAAVEGNGDGLYVIGAKAQLQSTIDTANAIAMDPNANQQQVDSAKAALEAAIQVFETKRINADINGGSVSIGDLAIVAAAYGKQQGQSGWNVLADVNKDGKVGIEDLAIIALAMLR